MTYIETIFRSFARGFGWTHGRLLAGWIWGRR